MTHSTSSYLLPIFMRLLTIHNQNAGPAIRDCVVTGTFFTGRQENAGMSSIKAIDLRRGKAIKFKDGIWVITFNEKVAKGNWRSSQVVQLKNIKTGQSHKERFRTDEQFEEVYLDHKEMEYSYASGDKYIFMDPESFELVELDSEFVGEDAMYLTPNLKVQVAFSEGQAITFELPNVVELKVIDTPPALAGATATNQLKDAECEGGARIKVPPFVTNGTMVKVDTDRKSVV